MCTPVGMLLHAHMRTHTRAHTYYCHHHLPSLPQSDPPTRTFLGPCQTPPGGIVTQNTHPVFSARMSSPYFLHP